MLTDTELQLAWVIYYASALIMLLALRPVFGWFRPKALGYFLFSILIVLLLTPAIASPEQNLWAPAHIVMLYSLLNDEILIATQAGLFMIGGWCVVGLLAALLHIINKMRHSHSPGRQPQKKQGKASAV